MATSPAIDPARRKRTRRLVDAGVAVMVLAGGGLAAAAVLVEPKPEPVVDAAEVRLQEAAFVLAGLPAPRSDVTRGWLTTVADDGATTSTEIGGAAFARATADGGTTCLSTSQELLVGRSEGVRSRATEGEPLAVAVRGGACVEVRTDDREAWVALGGRRVAAASAPVAGVAGIDAEVAWVLDVVERRLVALPLEGGTGVTTALRGLPRDLVVRSVPTEHEGRVHVLAESSGELRLVSIDPDSGRTDQRRIADVGPGRVDADDLGPRRGDTLHALTEDGVAHAVDLVTGSGRILTTVSSVDVGEWSADALLTATEEDGELRLEAHALDSGRRTASVRTVGLAPLVERGLHSWILVRG
ncbi:hypothetical protein GCM10027425_28510 [Alteromonas gracilis]